MPILNVKISGQIDEKLAQQIADELTDLTEKYLNKKPEVTAITLVAIPTENWFINKINLNNRSERSFYLDIKITESTNLKSEKEKYIQATFEQMKKLLGDLHEKSYVYIEDVKADAYGYGGLTQEFRYINSR